MNDWNISKQAAKLLSGVLVWDNHCSMPLRCKNTFLPQLERYIRSGVNMVSIKIGCGKNSLEDHVRVLAYFRSWIMRQPDKYVLALGVDDIHRAREQGKLAIAFDIEGTEGINNQISMLSAYYDLGVRWMCLTYNQNNLVGGGCHGDDQGLTDFGRQVIDEMAHVGMVVCCSHAGYKTTMDVMAYSQNPVIFSHSNPRALWDHERNISDETMKACAETDGVVGINGIGMFLGENDIRTKTIVRHIDYAVQLIGARHVGIGLDYVFDQEELKEVLRTQQHMFPAGKGYDAGIGIVEPERIPKITEALLKLGYPEYDVEAILGGNFLRVAEVVWK